MDAPAAAPDGPALSLLSLTPLPSWLPAVLAKVCNVTKASKAAKAMVPSTRYSVMLPRTASSLVTCTSMLRFAAGVHRHSNIRAPPTNRTQHH